MWGYARSAVEGGRGVDEPVAWRSVGACGRPGTARCRRVTDDSPGASESGERGPIRVLLVDDNDEWARFMARDMERAAPEVGVTVATSANEAMLTVRDRGDLDCIVTDYRMPEVDGLQLLERVREDHPDLPFLLVTGDGSEDVAARAIESGVTDYVVKEPGRDQTATFVGKVRQAVAEYRLQRALEESEQRYRTVTEQSRDAIGIVRDRRLVFWNGRFVELTGRERGALADRDLVETVVHPEDRERVAAVFARWERGDQRQSVHGTRVVRPDGTVRHCEFTGRPIDYEGEPATLVSVRDVTDRRQRERELEWERELNRTVQEALVEARTREDLERAVTAQLRRQGYALAWIGELDEGGLVPRVVEGDRTYVEAIDRDADTGGDSEPSVWAARTGEAQFLQEFGDLFPTAWRDEATERGYAGGAGLPLVYNDVTYGLLAVYHDRPNRFDETERRLLTELADTVAFAVHSIETEHALASDHAVDVVLQVPDDAYYLVALARDGAFVDCGTVGVRGTVPSDDETVIQYVTVADGDLAAVRAAIEGHPDVRDVVVIAESDPVRLQVTVAGPVPETLAAARGAVVRSTTVAAEGATIELRQSARDDVRATVEALDPPFASASVFSVVESERADTDGTRGDLTEKQATALAAAYHHGYFEQPRQRSATEVAEALGVTHSTFLQHLRVAQQKVFEERFE
jgi:PAS domain S-box-containing protein